MAEKIKKGKKRGESAAKVEKNSSRPPVGKKGTQAGKDPAKVAAGKKGAPQKGERRGGRAKGTPNKRTLQLREALEAAGLTDENHPVVMMFKVYTGEITMPVVVRKTDGDDSWNEVEDVPLDPPLRVRCMAEVAQYLEPKRKSIEVTGEDGEPVRVTLIDSATLPGWKNDPRNPENRTKRKQEQDADGK